MWRKKSHEFVCVSFTPTHTGTQTPAALLMTQLPVQVQFRGSQYVHCVCVCVCVCVFKCSMIGDAVLRYGVGMMLLHGDRRFHQQSTNNNSEMNSMIWGLSFVPQNIQRQRTFFPNCVSLRLRKQTLYTKHSVKVVHMHTAYRTFEWFSKMR